MAASRQQAILDRANAALREWREAHSESAAKDTKDDAAAPDLVQLNPSPVLVGEVGDFRIGTKRCITGQSEASP